ncbi:hypothetical protein N8A98_08640 [Devosia neptuniae]|uniref:HEAT repeat domain-containing protein n=1 Tax=Devosia neptuniae TaxID=191302 RepID=A0ABY6CHE2_9HYPH|nr:hypothetical protein [Devosia neptuniae]UXN71228.1 hypothetical protein N8A98_08640 [Devosia neptuniae]
MTDRDDIVARYLAGDLPQLLVERARRHLTSEDGRAFRAALEELHNDGTIDLLEIANTISSSTIGQHDFFIVMHLYCDLIPNLDAEVPVMLGAVKALVARAGNDLMSSMPNGVYRTWAELGDRARLTLIEIDENDPEDSAYVFLSLQALAKNSPDEALTKAISYVEGAAAPARSAGAKAIGTMALETPVARERVADALATASGKADDNSLGHILVAICEIARSNNDMQPSAVALIRTATPNVGDHAIHQLSLELMFHGEELPAGIVAGLTAVMHKVAITNSATLDNIDSAGVKLLTNGRMSEALALITPLIARHDELASLEALDGFSYALRQLAPNVLGEVIVSWLLSSEFNLGHAALSLVGNHNGDAPLVLEVARATLGLADSDKVLLAHRAIGYLFIHPITAASLVLGIIPGVTETSRKVIVEILFDPLLVNYSGELASWLTERAQTASAPLQPILRELLAQLEVYLEGLGKVGWLKELRPSERERLIENHRQHESARQVHKQAEKRSILFSLVSRSVILYGNGSISYYKGPDGENQRNEMKLHSFSHSFEAPRLDILEPFDLDYKLRVFRTMTLSKS